MRCFSTLPFTGLCLINPVKPRFLRQDGQYGLKKLVEHIWMVIGVARTCDSIYDLRDRVAALNGKTAVQMRFYLTLPSEK